MIYRLLGIPALVNFVRDCFAYVNISNYSNYTLVDDVQCMIFHNKYTRYSKTHTHTLDEKLIHHRISWELNPGMLGFLA